MCLTSFGNRCLSGILKEFEPVVALSLKPELSTESLAVPTRIVEGTLSPRVSLLR